MSLDAHALNKEHVKSLVIPDQLDDLGSGDSLDASLRQALAVRVSKSLQTTLDVEQLIKLFSQQIKPAIPHEKLSYRNDDAALQVTHGRGGRYTQSYELVVHGERLGTIEISRKWDFTAEESNIFEYALCSLVYPLRNSLLYRQALLAAHKDALTGVYNRSTLEDTLTREIKLAHRYQRPLAMIILDIDHFKSVNDQHGHATGDEVIKTIARCTGNCIRSTDILFRYGGEEFVALLSNTDLKGASLLAERIREAVAGKTICCGDTELNVTVSLGVAELAEGEKQAQFFARADQALYQAKNAGRNRVCTAE